MDQPEPLRQITAHGLGTAALGGVVAGSEIVDAALPRHVHGLLRDFAADIGVRPQRRRLFDIALRAAGAPGHPFDRMLAATDRQRRPSQFFRQPRGQLCQGQRLIQRSHIADGTQLPRLQTAFHAEPQQLAQLGVVAQFRMRIQRQVIGKQVDAVLDQQLHPLEFHAGDGRVFAFPEVAVVDENGVGVECDGALDQGAGGGNARDQGADLVASLHLQAIGRVVLEKLRLQQVIEFGEQGGAGDHGGGVSIGIAWCGAPFRVNLQTRLFQTPRRNDQPLMTTLARSLVTPVLAGLSIAALYLAFTSQQEPPVQRHEIVLIEQQVPAPTPTDKSADTLGSEGKVRLGDPVSYADAVAKAQPAVVNIYSTKIVTRDYHPLLDDPNIRRFFGLNEAPRRERMLSSLGSGVIVSPTGYILTNNHVIAGADEIRIALGDGRETFASVVGTDPETDLALLFIEMPDLPAITLAKSEAIRVGDIVLAIGNPFGVGQTVTKGIISALGRHNNLSVFVDFIQTDAAINPGNSGGALINAYGDLVGINTAIYSKSGGSQGIGFAIPVDTAKDGMIELLQHGQVIRGWLGVESQMLTPQLAAAANLPDVNGLLVTGIFKDGPAYAAGVRPGDIITHINGDASSQPKDVINLISAMQPGDTVTIRVIRQREPLDILATVGSRPTPATN